MHKLLVATTAFLLGLGASSLYSQNAKPKVNVNTASQNELETLPLVGKVKAKAIIEARKKGPFRSIEELDWIPLFGEKTMEKIRPLVTVGGVADKTKPGDKPKGNGAAKSRAEYEMPVEPATREEAILLGRLQNYPLAQLDRLLAEKTVEFERWRDQNHLTAGCKIKKGFATSREGEADLIQQCNFWKRRIFIVEKAIKQRREAS